MKHLALVAAHLTEPIARGFQKDVRKKKTNPIQKDNYIDYFLELAHSPVLCSKRLLLECREPGARPAATIDGGTNSGCCREYGFGDCTPSL